MTYVKPRKYLYYLKNRGASLNKLINQDFQIDYNFSGQLKINKTEVKSLLIKLGAKRIFK